MPINLSILRPARLNISVIWPVFRFLTSSSYLSSWGASLVATMAGGCCISHDRRRLAMTVLKVSTALKVPPPW